MMTKTPQKALVDLVIEAMIRKLEKQKEFDQKNIEAVIRIAKNGSLTKAKQIIDAIELNSRDQPNETTGS